MNPSLGSTFSSALLLNDSVIFSVSAKAMTVIPGYSSESIFDVINDKCNYLFFLLFMGACFSTFDSKNLLQQQEKTF